MKEVSSVGRSVKYWCLLFGLSVAVMSGCASAKLQEARSEFYSGNLDQASEALSNPDEISSREQLLFYMEKGVILHYAGQYPESILALREASDLIKKQEIISASRQAASMVTSEWITDYKGEYAERLLVHTYLMMNYLMLGDPESALVEGKQALAVYDQYPVCSGDFFTRALIAHCFEALGDINGAYIEYKKLAELLPSPELVAEKLCVLGGQLGFDDEVEVYRKSLPESALKPAGTDDFAELIVFAAQGRAPVKVPRNIVLPPSIRFSFATYEDVTDYFYPLFVNSPEGSGSGSIITTDVGQVLKASLNDRLTQIIAKETARVVAKEAIANQMDDPVVELLVRIAFLVMEEPDTRSWETLPAYLTLVRSPLRKGSNRIDLGRGGGGMPVLEIVVSPKHPRYYYQSIRNGGYHHAMSPSPVE
ncbi:MAG: hypothetical protein WA081_05475 [Desulfosalsimonadaceae bacterium]